MPAAAHACVYSDQRDSHGHRGLSLSQRVYAQGKCCRVCRSFFFFLLFCLFLGLFFLFFLFFWGGEEEKGGGGVFKLSSHGASAQSFLKTYLGGSV